METFAQVWFVLAAVGLNVAAIVGIVSLVGVTVYKSRGRET